MLSIIGIIAPTIYIGGTSYFAQAYDYHRKKDLKDLEVVMEYYYDVASAYPSSIPPCGEPLMYNNRAILDSFPCDPTTDEPYAYLTDELTQYQWYKIYTHLERNEDQSIPLISCADGCGPGCAYNFGLASSNISVTTCIWPDQNNSPTATNEPTDTPQPTPEPNTQTNPTNSPTEPVISPIPPPFANYVCAPGGGQPGICEVFDNPDRSLCPFVYPNDPTCQNQCDSKENRCVNASGKYKAN